MYKIKQISLNYYAYVYYSMTGLCGNYDGNKENDMMMSNGSYPDPGVSH